MYFYLICGHVSDCITTRLKTLVQTDSGLKMHHTVVQSRLTRSQPMSWGYRGQITVLEKKLVRTNLSFYLSSMLMNIQ